MSEAEFGNDSRLIPIAIRDTDLSMTETLIHLRQRADVRIIRAFIDQMMRHDPARSGP